MEEKPKQDNSGCWGIIIIFIIVGIGLLNNSTKRNTSLNNISSDIVSCLVPLNCGGIAITATREQCKTISCCNVGSYWYLLSSKEECVIAQYEYTQKQREQITNLISSFMVSDKGTSTNYSEYYKSAGSCCMVCTVGKACGNSCISKDKTCNVGPGCAC